MSTKIMDNQRIVEFIQNNFSIEWTKWKCTIISSFIKEITQEARKLKPDILINVHVLPWRQIDFNGTIEKIAGRDLKEIAKIVDIILPMFYSPMLKRSG
ncbi:MAG: hypothetical protein ACFFAE_11775 [Candidatus Hodarchaeota archaeon]